MFRALENSLYVKDSVKYDVIRKRANAFSSIYAGSNIIQDDVFHIIENYVFQQGMQMELFRFPFGDDDFCACTFIREGRVFVVINSAMPLAKQIFAAAHELYHLYNYFEDYDPAYQQRGSILDSATVDEDTTKLEDMEANAFAGLVLAPSRLLQEQIEIYQIRRENMGTREVLMLMEIFAIPYKAIILRLFEEKLIGEDDVRRLFRIPEKDIRDQINLTGRAKRWLRKTEDEISFGSLYENMERVFRLDAVEHGRLRQDKERIREIINTIAEAE